MIKITITKKNEFIKSVAVSGHANYADYGKDIVCAGVSSIIVGGINALTSIFNKDTFKIEVKEGYAYVETYKLDNKDIQLILKTIVIQLKGIKESYSKFVKIKELEG